MQESLIIGGKDQSLDELMDRLHRLSPDVSSVEVALAVAHPPSLESQVAELIKTPY